MQQTVNSSQSISSDRDQCFAFIKATKLVNCYVHYNAEFEKYGQYTSAYIYFMKADKIALMTSD